MMRVGIDFGGVIVKPGGTVNKEDTTDRFESWKPQADVFDSVQALVTACDGNVWIVSKAGRRMEARTREWLERTRFYELTGLERINVKFCRSRTDKRIHCEQHRITHFIDDRIHVMQILQGVVPHLFRFAPECERSKTPDFVMHVVSWSEFLDRLRTI